ncbi:MAG TPA: polysaccharide biosynthesis/export family protein [Terriglobales bacterium]|nr:polysaccharide biosynthesis/export family protein [Terriglobales bacterium]
MNKAIVLLACVLAVASPSVSLAQEPAEQGGENTLTPARQTDNRSDVVDALPPEVAIQPAFSQRHKRYALRPSDSMEIRFSYTPEFNEVVTVLPDGFITLKEVGELYVQGKTVEEASQLIRSAYAKVLADPVITIVLKNFQRPYFTVGGELLKPGKYDLHGDLTVTEAVQMAGGFRDSAKHSEVLLFRRVSDQWVQVRKLNIKKMLSSADLREDLQLLPGDMLFVPKNRISKLRQWLPTSSVGVRPYP